MVDRCCFALIPITIGARILTSLTILCSSASLLHVLSPISTLTPWYRLGTIVLNAVEIGAAVLVFIACRKRSAMRMVPMLCYCLLSIVWWAFVFVIGVMGVFSHSETHLPLPISAAISIALQIWCTTIFWSCYNHLNTNSEPSLSLSRA